MLIKELTLKNFRQFKDRETIKFSTDKNTNITLILGDNTSGKTTLLQAFLWCFYNVVNFKSKDRIFNEENAMSMGDGQQLPIEVTVKLEHDNIDYTIERKQFCEKRNGSVSLISRPTLKIFYKTSQGETEEVLPIDVQHTMNNILPEELSSYFFYDTERFGNITEKNDVTKAVKGLLGLTILENTIEHLGRRTRSDSVIGQFYNELDRDGDEKIKQIAKKINEDDKNIQMYKRGMSEQKEQKRYYEEDLKDKEAQLRELQSTMDLQIKIDNKRSRIEGIENELGRSQTNFLKFFHDRSFSFFLQPLTNTLQRFLDETEIKDEGIRSMSSDSIDDIIDRGYCVCGTEVKEGSTAYNELQKALEYLPPQSLGIMVRNYQNQLEFFSEKDKNFFTLLSDIHKQIVQSKDDIDRLNHEIEIYSEKIKEKENAEDLQSEVETIRSRIKQRDEKINNLYLQKGGAKDRLQKNKKKHEKLVRVNENNREILTLLKYAEEVAKWFQKDFDKRNKAITNKIKERVNYYFQKIYHGNRRVEIDTSYKVTLHSTNSELDVSTDESAGLETVKNFSFIAGLVDMAKSKLESEQDEGDASLEFKEEYPLVLDAPFSNVDERHVLNISKVLPEVTGQLILIVMAKDWNYAEDELDKKVGKIYHLLKRSETCTEIKEGY